MAGVIDAHTRVYEKPQGRGYVRLGIEQHPWGGLHASLNELQAHEFHYSALDGLPADSRFAYRVERGTGIDGSHDGLVYKNLLASYTHQRHTAANPWVHAFLNFVQTHKQRPLNGLAGAL